MSAEANFWKKTMESMNPGWKIHMPDGLHKPDVSLSSVDFRIYCINATTGWTCGAGLESKGLESMLQENRSSNAFGQACDAAVLLGLKISSASERDKELIDEALTACTAAIVFSQSYRMLREVYGIRTGHWCFLLYSCKDGSTIGRPAYLGNTPAGKFMTEAELFYGLKPFIHADLNGKCPSVGSMINKGGGVTISESIMKA